jgi:hypothetical protein
MEPSEACAEVNEPDRLSFRFAHCSILARLSGDSDCPFTAIFEEQLLGIAALCVLPRHHLPPLG